MVIFPGYAEVKLTPKSLQVFARHPNLADWLEEQGGHLVCRWDGNTAWSLPAEHPPRTLEEIRYFLGRLYASSLAVAGSSVEDIAQMLFQSFDIDEPDATAMGQAALGLEVRL